MYIFHRYSQFDRWFIVYDTKGIEVGTIDKRGDYYVFIPHINVQFFTEQQLSCIEDKLKELNAEASVE